MQTAEPLKILLITPSYKPAYCYGGPTVSVSELAEALVNAGHPVTVYTTTANGKSELDVETGKKVVVNGVEVFYFRRITGDHTHISPALWKKLWSTISDFDVVHLQSWWSLLIMGVALTCRWRGKTYIISPRGMLGDYSFKHQHSFAKKVLHGLMGKRLLKNSILHATTELEKKDCLRIHANWKGFVLHNLVQLPKIPGGDHSKRGDLFTIGFLSRIDPKKGIELLFNALARVDFNYRLLMAGAGEDGYIDQLKATAVKLGIAEKIEWVGWMNNDQKFSFFQKLDLFVLTSYNENFAIAVTESLAMGTPVLVSEMVGLADYVIANQLGWVCKTEVTSIEEKLEEAYIDKAMRVKIYEEAPAAIRRDFNHATLAGKYVDQYHEILQR